MLIQMAIIVLLAAIVVFFSRDFIEYMKKLFKIPLLAWMLPIVIASLAVVYFNHWVVWAVLTAKVKIISFYLAIVGLASFPGNNLIAAVLVLLIFSVLPTLLINIYSSRSFYKEFEHRYITSVLLWIFCAMLLVS